MSQAKHTPGPWVVDGDVIRGDQQRNGSISVASMLDVSYPYGRRAGESKHANARLIAAAPDLLDAAKLVIAWYEAEDDHSKADFYQRMDMCRESESALRAAIAKATGGE